MKEHLENNFTVPKEDENIAEKEINESIDFELGVYLRVILEKVL